MGVEHRFALMSQSSLDSLDSKQSDSLDSKHNLTPSRGPVQLDIKVDDEGWQVVPPNHRRRPVTPVTPERKPPRNLDELIDVVRERAYFNQLSAQGACHSPPTPIPLPLDALWDADDNSILGTLRRLNESPEPQTPTTAVLTGYPEGPAGPKKKQRRRETERELDVLKKPKLTASSGLTRERLEKAWTKPSVPRDFKPVVVAPKGSASTTKLVTPRVPSLVPAPSSISPVVVPTTSHPDSEAPIEGRAVRDVVLSKWIHYMVPVADYLGWTHGQIGKPGELDIGYMIEGNRYVRVLLPVSLIRALQAWWAGRETTYDNYLVSVQYCRNLCRKAVFTDIEEARAMTFAPYVAYSVGAEGRNKVLAAACGRVRPSGVWTACKLAAGAVAALSLPSTCLAAAATTTVQAATIAGGVAFAVPLVTAAAVLAAGYVVTKSFVRHLPKARAQVDCVDSVSQPPPMNPDAEVRTVPTNRSYNRVSLPAVATGIPVAGCEPTVYASNQNNVIAALRKRSAATPPACDERIRSDFLDRVFTRIRRWLGRPFRINIPRDPDLWLAHVNRWIDGSNSSPSVKKRNREAAKWLYDHGITSHSTLSPDQVHEWTKREVTVKRETVLKDPTGSPRQIMSATPFFNVLVNPFISEFTGLVRHRLQREPKKSCPVYYAPGASPKEVAELQLRHELLHKHNDDQKSYDLTQREDSGRREFRLFKDYGLPTGSAQLIDRNLEGTHGSSREGVVFKMPYIRQSGDGHTTVGNTMLATAVRTELVSMSTGKEPTLDDMLDVAGGDDGSLMTAQALPDLERVAATVGFPLTSQRCSHMYELEFLGCRWTETDLGPVYVPMAGRTIAKLAYSVKATPETADAIARGAALSFAHSSSGVPPLASVVRTILRLTESVKPIHPPEEPWKMSSSYTGRPTHTTWFHIGQVYGWTQEMQVELDRQLDSLTKLGEVVDIPLLRMLIDRDYARDNPEPSLAAPVIEEKYSEEQKLELPTRAAVMVTLIDGSTRFVDYQDDLLAVVERAHDIGPPVDWDDINVSVNGRPVDKYGHLLPGDIVQVRLKLRGGSLSGVAVHNLVATASSALRMVYAAAPAVFRDAAVEGAADAVWDKWVVLSKPTSDEKESPRETPPVRDISVSLSGIAHHTTWIDGEDVASVVSRAIGVPITSPLFGKVMPYIGTKPVGWKDKVWGESIHLDVKGMGGANISRTEKVLNRLQNAVGILDSSKGYFMTQVDGFHDHQFVQRGKCDSINAASVPECYKQTFQLSSTLSGNWDCNLTIFPDLLANPWYPYAQYILDSTSGVSTNAMGSQGTNSAFPSAGLSATIVASGNPTPMNANLINYPLVPAKAGPGGTYAPKLSGPSRCLSVWVEVINNTAPLYQQGTVTCWRQPQPGLADATTWNVVAADTSAPTPLIQGAWSTIIAPAPPNSVAEAMLLQGTRQWHAKEGCMFYTTPSQDELPIIQNQALASVYYEDSPTDATLYGPSYVSSGFAGQSLTLNTCTFRQTYRSPFNMSGVFFTGLSPQTTLTVNVRTYLEIFPSQLTNPLTPLAQPSAPYDEVCLRLISEIMKEMPPGVMLCENGLGDWLSDIVGKVSSFVAPIARTVGSVASLIPHPIAQGVGRIANTIGEVSGNLVPSSATVRDDGVQAAVQREQTAEKRVKRAVAKQQVAARQVAATAKLRARSSAAANNRLANATAMVPVRRKGGVAFTV